MGAIKEKFNNMYEKITEPAKFQVAKLRKADKMIKQNDEQTKLLKEILLELKKRRKK